MYYIYILFSLKTNKYYIGSTDDLARRLKHHNGGSTPSTKSGRTEKEQKLSRVLDPKREYPLTKLMGVIKSNFI